MEGHCLPEFFFKHTLVCLWLIGKRIKVISSNAEYYATAVDIDKNARLIVRDENGDMHTLSSAEVSVREGQI